jgi:hypothetical protein
MRLASRVQQQQRQQQQQQQQHQHQHQSVQHAVHSTCGSSAPLQQGRYAHPSIQHLQASTSFASTTSTAWLPEQRGLVQVAMPVQTHGSYVACTRNGKASRSSFAVVTTAAAELMPTTSVAASGPATLHGCRRTVHPRAASIAVPCRMPCRQRCV